MAANPDDPSHAYILIGTLCGVVAIWMFVHAFVPRWRPDWRWLEGLSTMRVSTGGYITHGMAFSVWAVGALSSGFHLPPLAGHGTLFLIVGLLLTIGAEAYGLRGTDHRGRPRT